MSKTNCWTFMSCGREPGGTKVEDLGICPASQEYHLDGTHGGKNAGRACWAVAGTLCGDEVQGTFAQKYKNCGVCDFYNTVKTEQGEDFQMTIVLIEKLEGKQA
jgi:hypothetical protein